MKILETLMLLAVAVSALWIYVTLVVLIFANWRNERRG